MTPAKRLIASTLSVVALSMSAPVLADAQSGLVNVDVSNVANNIAKNISVDVSQIPATVQVPVGIAANVCGLDANVLAKQAQGGTANCGATTTSVALDQLVQRKISSKGQS